MSRVYRPIRSQVILRLKRQVVLPPGPPWEGRVQVPWPLRWPVGTENDPGDDHEDRPHQPHEDAPPHVLRIRSRGHLEPGGELDGLIGRHRAQIPQERRERRRAGQQTQSAGGDEGRADRGAPPHPEERVPQGVDGGGVPTDSRQQRHEHEDLPRRHLRRREGLRQAHGLTVHDQEAGGHVGVAVEAGPPEAHPRHPRADGLPVGHQPHPPLHQPQSHGRQRPAHAAQPHGPELGMDGVSRGGHGAASGDPSHTGPHPETCCRRAHLAVEASGSHVISSQRSLPPVTG